MISPVVALSMELIKRPSVTPADSGCQALLAEQLSLTGFNVSHLPFGDVHNLWAVHGDSGPLLCFVGHTDVVPPGPLEAWQYPPFEPTIHGANLYGRGASDMKTGVAAMLIASTAFVKDNPKHKGRIGILLTSDEEGAAINGVKKVMDYLHQKKETIRWAIVAEPSSDKQFGDTIKNGRRGSLSAKLKVIGQQGHIAYPHKAHNPIIAIMPWMQSMLNNHWGDGNLSFPPVSLQFSRFAADGMADNIIPGLLEADFNFRYGNETTAEALRNKTESLLQTAKLNYELKWHESGSPFLSDAGSLVQALGQAIKQHTAQTATLATTGGTSDARYMAPYGIEIAEFGVINETAHKINEHVAVTDIEKLSAIYRQVIDILLMPESMT